MTLDLLDKLLAGTLVLFGVMAVLHDYAGWRFYVRGEGYGPFAGDAWKPETPKQRVLLGVFFTVSFAWAQSAALMLALLFAGNPLGPWLGVIGLAFTLPQLLLALRFVAWDYVAIGIYAAHILALSAWTAKAFAR
jgi:uncharacterized membrane protein